MLSIRNAEATDFEALQNFMNKEGQWDNKNPIDFSTIETMLLVDDELILGYATSALMANQPFISSIYIPEMLRKHLMGDSLLRGLLFYFMNRGFERVYASNNTLISDFLIHEGFGVIDSGLEVVLDDFFNQKCRGCRDAS